MQFFSSLETTINAETRVPIALRPVGVCSPPIRTRPGFLKSLIAVPFTLFLVRFENYVVITKIDVTITGKIGYEIHQINC